MDLKNLMPANMEPLAVIVMLGLVAAMLICFDKLVRMYVVKLHKRQQMHDRKVLAAKAEEKRQEAIGLYEVDE